MILGQDSLGQTEPGLVAFYDIWPGNRAGLFLQPWSPLGMDPAQVSIPSMCIP